MNFLIVGMSGLVGVALVLAVKHHSKLRKAIRTIKADALRDLRSTLRKYDLGEHLFSQQDGNHLREKIKDKILDSLRPLASGMDVWEVIVGSEKTRSLFNESIEIIYNGIQEDRDSNYGRILTIREEIEEIKEYAQQHPTSVKYFYLDELPILKMEKHKLKSIIRSVLIENLLVSALDTETVGILDDAVEDIYNAVYTFHNLYMNPDAIDTTEDEDNSELGTNTSEIFSGTASSERLDLLDDEEFLEFLNTGKLPERLQQSQESVTTSEVEAPTALINHGGIHALHHYQPKRGGNNPNFDEVSQQILNLKDSKTPAIKRFANDLHAHIPKDVVLCIVPPSRVGYGDNKSIGLVAKELCNYDRIDGTQCLFRHTELERKLSHGGSRNRATHENSIEVRNSQIFKNKDVWLIDDVVTTGNSMRVCAKKLIDNGAKEVHCIAVGATVWTPPVGATEYGDIPF